MGKKVLRTKLCELLGIEYPIILAGMGTQSGYTLAAAVSNAGGLGVVGAALLTPEKIREWVRLMRTLTDKPFGFDLMLPSSIGPTKTVDEYRVMLPAKQVAYVDRVKEEFKIPEPKKIKRDWDLMSPEMARKQFEVLVEEHVPCFTAGLGTPDWLVPLAHSVGMKVIALIGSVRQAERVEKQGVDIIVAQGYDAGGHTGRIGTFSLVPQVVDAVSIPVVAAGGIGDGRGLAAALCFGAVGVLCGTAFLATPEAMIDAVEYGAYTPEAVELHKKRILEASVGDARISPVYSGKTMRMIRNKVTETWEKSGVPTLPMPLQGILIQSLQGGVMEMGYDGEEYTYAPAGQVCGMINKVENASAIVERMVSEAVEILSNRLPSEVEVGEISNDKQSC